MLEARALVWPDEAACADTARALAARPGLRRAFIELRGDLGAGKTTFTRHLLHALGVTGPIKSPTYAVLEPYCVEGPDVLPLDPGRLGPAQLDISHFDFYRFEDPQEFEDAGFRDVFAAQGLKIAEWPDNAHGLLPPCDLRIDITVRADESRAVRLSAHTLLGVSLLP
jgi:tRNA threonylcarbamoyladenosine biosynthesis protein TsaE